MRGGAHGVGTLKRVAEKAEGILISGKRRGCGNNFLNKIFKACILVVIWG